MLQQQPVKERTLSFFSNLTQAWRRRFGATSELNEPILDLALERMALEPVKALQPEGVEPALAPQSPVPPVIEPELAPLPEVAELALAPQSPVLPVIEPELALLPEAAELALAPQSPVIEPELALLPEVVEPMPALKHEVPELLPDKEVPVANNVRESLSKLEAIDGFVGASIADSESGMVLGHTGGAGLLNMEVAAAANSEVVRSKRKAMRALNLRDDIEDILITLGRQYHLLRPLKIKPTLFIYLALDRQKSNLAMARYSLADVEKEINV